MENIKIKINVDLPRTLWRKVKAQAALSGESLSVYVTRVLEKAVKEKD